MYGNTVSITVFAYVFTVLAYSGVGAEPSLTVIHVATDETRGSVVCSTSGMAGTFIRNVASRVEAAGQVRCGQKSTKFGPRLLSNSYFKANFLALFPNYLLDPR